MPREPTSSRGPRSVGEPLPQHIERMVRTVLVALIKAAEDSRDKFQARSEVVGQLDKTQTFATWKPTFDERVGNVAGGEQATVEQAGGEQAEAVVERVDFRDQVQGCSIIVAVPAFQELG